MRADSLEKALQNRPTPDTLVKEGIMNRELSDRLSITFFTETNGYIAEENPLKEV